MSGTRFGILSPCGLRFSACIYNGIEDLKIVRRQSVISSYSDKLAQQYCLQYSSGLRCLYYSRGARRPGWLWWILALGNAQRFANEGKNSIEKPTVYKVF